MNDRYLFRGKRVKGSHCTGCDSENSLDEIRANGYISCCPERRITQWVEGGLFVNDKDVHFIMVPEGTFFMVDPETAGQCTGQMDKNGKLIFEGDVVQGNLFDLRLPTRGVVIYDDKHGCWASKNEGGITLLFKIASKEVIGNVTDNHEFMDPK